MCNDELNISDLSIKEEGETTPEVEIKIAEKAKEESKKSEQKTETPQNKPVKPKGVLNELFDEVDVNLSKPKEDEVMESVAQQQFQSNQIEADPEPPHEDADTKKMDKFKMIIFMVFSAAIFTGVVGFFIMPDDLFKKEKPKKKEKQVETIDNTVAQLKRYNRNNFKRSQNGEPKTPQDLPAQNSRPNNTPTNVTNSKSNKVVRKTAHKSRRNRYNPNTFRDKAIIDKYKGVNPAAAASEPVRNPGFTLDMVEPDTGDSKIQVIGAKKKKQAAKTAYDIEVKARLKKGIRSTAGSMVVAQTTKSVKEFPAKTLFYGRAKFSNGRTYIQFTKFIKPNGRQGKIAAEAMSGKDPGIVSQVTDVSMNNANKSLKAGAIDVGGKIADNVLARVTGGATRGTLSDPANDLKAKQERAKQQVEYYVPAKTSFTIYIY